MGFLRQAVLVLRKDLRLEMRRGDNLLTMFFFGALLLFVFHFSFDIEPDRIAAMTPALLWLSFLFTGTLGLTQIFPTGTRKPLPRCAPPIAARSWRFLCRQERL